MHGTLICAVTDGAENDDAVAQAIAISERLGLRLVLTHVVDGIVGGNGNGNGNGEESFTMKADRTGAEQRLAQLADEHGIEQTAECRVAVGDPAVLLGQIASEEAADVIVVGSRERGWPARAREPACRGARDGDSGADPDRTARDRRPQPRHAANGARRANVAPWPGARCRSSGASSPSTRACWRRSRSC